MKSVTLFAFVVGGSLIKYCSFEGVAKKFVGIRVGIDKNIVINYCYISMFYALNSTPAPTIFKINLRLPPHIYSKKPIFNGFFFVCTFCAGGLTHS